VQVEQAVTTERSRRFAWWLVPALALLFGLGVLALVWMPYVPNAAGHLGPDYAIWLPYLLAGVFWHVNSPWWAIAWFNPALCGGVPLGADPQGSYISLAQFLAFAVGPLRAIQVNFLAFAAVGFLGTYWLARARFALSLPASVLAGLLFMLNGFYGARFAVGHLSFAPFMLLPAMAACVAGSGPGITGRIGSCCGFGLLLAVAVQGGMAVLVMPLYLSLLVVLVLLALARGGGLITSLSRLIGGSVIGLGLCAGKLAAALGLMAHIPRDNYPLPGFDNLAVALWMACRSLFLWPSDSMARAIEHSMLRLELHEFSYGVGVAPVLLVLACAWFVWRPELRVVLRRHALLLELLTLLLLVPLVLNTYTPTVAEFLKHIPVLRSSSSLLRWFAAYMLPAVLAGALALDRLGRSVPVGRWAMSCGCVALTVLGLSLTDRGFYGPGGIGVYDPSRIARSFSAVMATGRVPRVTAITLLTKPDGSADMSLARQDSLIWGGSQLLCYDALFGYRLENLPRGVLHVGSVFDITDANSGGSRLNVKDPACYVFPKANQCRPGDEFLASQRDAAADFIAYKPFGWARPWWAVAADWTSLVSLGGVLAALGFSLAWHVRPAR
jgi:hypothetical protein